VGSGRGLILLAKGAAVPLSVRAWLLGRDGSKLLPSPSVPYLFEMFKEKN
jgi:hypothetical protein